jgi:hypothetical protein
LAAGYMVVGSSASASADRKVHLDRSSFDKLERKSRSRRFQKWD